MRRLAVLSLHTSPLAQPGTGDGGGMNVYVRELSSALARAGVTCDVFTRAWTDDLPVVQPIEPGLRLHHISAGPPATMAKEELPDGGRRVRRRASSSGCRRPRASGRGRPVVRRRARQLLAERASPATASSTSSTCRSCRTFHTLDRVKAEASPEEVDADAAHRRAEAEAEVIRCSDTVLASCAVEAGQIVRAVSSADPGRIRIVAPGVDHAFFGPGDRRQARRALGLPTDGPLLLFVGRIQPLKARPTSPCAPSAGAPAGHPDARLVVVGGPSGPHGAERTGADLASWCAKLGARRPGRLRPAPAPRAALDLLPGGRRLPRSQPLGVLRAGGARGGGLRDSGGGLRRRRAPQPRRPRPHRVPGRGCACPSPSPPGPPDTRRAAAGRAAEHGARCCGRAATRGPRPPTGCGRSTPS